MRVCVYGAGAIGGHLAARLAGNGHEVTVIARGAHLAAMRAGGITVRTPSETLHAAVHATDDPREAGVQDAVLVTAKAPALPGIAPLLAPLLGVETPVAFVMNGIPWWYGHDPDRWPEFRKRYWAELKDLGDFLVLLKYVIKDRKVTFVFAARDEERNSAVALSEFLKG
jgi:ketopantoate reductase